MDIYQAALSLVIHKDGAATETDVDDLLDRYERKSGLLINKAEFMQSLHEATQHYSAQSKCLFVCTEIHCAGKTIIPLDPESLGALGASLDCAVEATGCHWQCEFAPVFTIKLSAESWLFGSNLSLRDASDLKQVVSGRLRNEANEGRRKP